METTTKTNKEQKDEQISRIVQLRSELGRKALTDAFLQRMSSVDRALELEGLEAQRQFNADFSLND